MLNAWEMTREFMKNREPSELRKIFAYALGKAWRLAKRAVELAAISLGQLESELMDLKNRTRLSCAQMERLGELYRLVPEKKAQVDREAKRNLIERAGGQCVSVAFVKKDGSRRVMRVNQAALKSHVKGDSASEAGRKAAETRKARHPNLMPVYDVEKAAIRSINLSTVQTITTGGQTHSFI
ncbi:MAG: hypothetical protein AAGB19_08655 [Cyanobacteria bacterium P01_F01_bin.3]